MSSDEEFFEDLLRDAEDYLVAGERIDGLDDVTLDPQPGHMDYGIDHVQKARGRNISVDEIEQVVFEEPVPEERTSRRDPQNTMFWGFTRSGRALVVVCRDHRHEEDRRLLLVTAFEEDEQQWRSR